ncbi:WD40 repeat-like protein [Pilatotrama ljubarskyi]|nr:WD40 repeat-like protein [Pilatotrama ljubarskyi]
MAGFPRGSFLASAALDGKACIWSLPDACLLHVFSGSIPILSIAWKDNGEDTIICGLEDGTVVCLTVTQSDLQVFGFWAHSFPVECLRASRGFLASGAHEEVRIWRETGTVTPASEWAREAQLPAPPKTSYNRLLKVVVTSLHWLPGPKGHIRLLVTYLNHGVHIFDTRTWEQIGSVPIYGQIADASISQDGHLIAVSNVISGFDVYAVDSGAAVCSFGHTVGEFRKVPVLFVHDGLALVGGNMHGDVHLWDVDSGRKLHSLVHPST